MHDYEKYIYIYSIYTCKYIFLIPRQTHLKFTMVDGNGGDNDSDDADCVTAAAAAVAAAADDDDDDDGY